MSSMDRRSFLRAMARAGLSTAALSSLPPALRTAFAAAAKPDPLGPRDMIIRNDRPEHWETSLEALGRSWITRNDRFFVRSHLGTPTPDLATYRLDIAGLVNAALSLSIAQLTAQPHQEGVITNARDRISSASPS